MPLLASAELYNIQLNGFNTTTMSGAARIGSSGDVWNNPDWVGVATGSTTLFSGVTLLDSSGASLGASAAMTALFNNNTAGWNSGTFNHYSGQTAGSATPVLMDRLVKVDYESGGSGLNAMTLTLSGLPSNTVVTVYVYGAGNGSGQGGQWTLNGGTAKIIAYDGSSTGRDVTLASSEGISWASFDGTTDASGQLTFNATGPSGGNPWWQTYMNGVQIQVGAPPALAPSISDLNDVRASSGDDITLAPKVGGTPSPTLQWLENGSDLAGETNATLTLSNVDTNQNGSVYSLIAANSEGSVTNSMTLTVTGYSSMSMVALSPINGESGVCYDTLLPITFSEAPVLKSGGEIRIYNTNDLVTPVDIIDLSQNLAGDVQPRSLGGETFHTYPVIIDGNTATIYPHAGVMSPNETYCVLIDAGVFSDAAADNFVGINSPSTWQFTTKPTGPADPNDLVVAADGSGDFCTVQGALDSLPANNTTDTLINIRDGVYLEIVNIRNKNNVILRGESRAGTIIRYPNNAEIASGGSTHYRMTLKVNADDVSIENLTLHNSTPQGGGQAEALMLETGAARFIMNNATVSSRQDTILANQNSSQGYFNDVRVEGNYDYIWGGGNLFFTNCLIHTISGAGSANITAARTDTGGSWQTPDGLLWSRNGFSFVDCRFEADAGVSGITLAGHNGKPGGCDSWINCAFDTSSHVGPSADIADQYNFWQFGNTDLSGLNPAVFDHVVALTNSDSRLLAAQDAVTWLNGWSAQLLPNILEQPLDQQILQGGSISFAVTATGIPAPTYQWMHGGTNLVGETNATLIISATQTGDAGDYAVEVANAAGTVASSTATLTVTMPVPPVIGDATMLEDGSFQFSARGGSNQNYRIWASEDLILTPVTNTWTLLGSGVFADGPAVIVDVDATNYLQRFYRITVP